MQLNWHMPLEEESLCGTQVVYGTQSVRQNYVRTVYQYVRAYMHITYILIYTRIKLTMCVCMCVYVSVHAHVYACVCAYACTCVHVRTSMYRIAGNFGGGVLIFVIFNPRNFPPPKFSVGY